MSLPNDGKPRSAKPPGYWQKMTAPWSCIHVRIERRSYRRSAPLSGLTALAMLRECSSVKYNCPSRRINVTRRSHLHIESIGKCAFDHAQSW